MDLVKPDKLKLTMSLRVLWGENDASNPVIVLASRGVEHNQALSGRERRILLLKLLCADMRTLCETCVDRGTCELSDRFHRHNTKIDVVKEYECATDRVHQIQLFVDLLI